MPCKLRSAQRTIINGWQFRALGNPTAAAAKEWHPATVPGVVQTDLLAEQAHPRSVLRQQRSATAVDRPDRLGIPDEVPGRCRHPRRRARGTRLRWTRYLCRVFVNDQKVLEAGNMFRTWRVDVKKNVKSRRQHAARRVPFAGDDVAAEAAQLALITCSR